jgi:hypothetical protein
MTEGASKCKRKDEKADGRRTGGRSAALMMMLVLLAKGSFHEVAILFAIAL